MPSRIEDYALIGDCRTAALVARDGSIDWLCWPRFDSAACFAALLGTPENGRWKIAPATAGVSVSRRYRENTLILETEFETAEGAVRLVDFMPLHESASDLVRVVIGLRGRVAMDMELMLRFDYGAALPWVTRLEDGSVKAIVGPNMAVLRAGVPVQCDRDRTWARFTVGKGESVSFLLTYSPSHLAVAKPVDADSALESTQAYWQDWCAQSSISAEWSEAVTRSLITLKALTYAPTGGVVAAPTTSLPEKLGGVRNWDYRYCWLRDATLTLLALMGAGYFKEAAAWRSWLHRAIAGNPAQAQIMYGVAGERRLDEWTIGWLPGYENSQPVRIGNAAAGQLQLDVYGEVLDALHQARKGGLGSDGEAWSLQKALIAHLETVWEEPDRGIWEVRGGPRHFTYSKVMAWVAVDRAIKGVETCGLEGPVDEWRALRERIHEDVCRNGYNETLGSFAQSYGSMTLDASLLMIPLTGFLPANDPRVCATIAAIERELMVDGLVLRYRTEDSDDGLPPGEAPFLACSFWLADAYVLQGRLDEARALFERLLTLRNDVGLLSEEYDVANARLLGNFPQAFSHVALVDTALNLTRAQSPATQRGEDAPAKRPDAR